MKDLEHELREVLRQRLDPLIPASLIPDPIVQQVKRRRLVKLAATSVGAFALSLTGFLVVQALEPQGFERRVGPATTGDSTWRGLWPQDTRREAEDAQAAADRGDHSYAWQLAPDGEQVALRYVREVLGWSNFEGLDMHAEDVLRRLRLIQCGSGANPDYPEIRCAPSDDRTYPSVSITVERLLRPDEKGLWFVTKVESTSLRQAKPSSEQDVRSLVIAFLERRLRGSGAEEYLSQDAKNRFSGGLQLSPLYGPYDRYEIAFLHGPLWPFGGFEVGIRIFNRSGRVVVQETLFVSPGTDISGKERPLVISGGRGGLTGP